MSSPYHVPTDIILYLSLDPALNTKLTFLKHDCALVTMQGIRIHDDDTQESEFKQTRPGNSYKHYSLKPQPQMHKSVVCLTLNFTLSGVSFCWDSSAVIHWILYLDTHQNQFHMSCTPLSNLSSSCPSWASPVFPYVPTCSLCQKPLHPQI